MKRPRLLGVSTRGIERAVRRGHLNVVYHDSKHGKKAWFSPGDLERYRQQQQCAEPCGIHDRFRWADDWHCLFLWSTCSRVR